VIFGRPPSGRGRQRQYRRHLERLVELNPRIPEANVACGEWLHSVGRLAQSGKPLERAARLYPDSPELRQILIEYYALRDIATRAAVFKAFDAKGLSGNNRSLWSRLGSVRCRC
jgi:hypothetical protein